MLEGMNNMKNIFIKNIIANYIGKFWGFASIYLFIPLYIKILGVEAYGVINFYSVLLSILFIADAGFSATLNREMARLDDNKGRAKTLKTIEYSYLFIAIFIISLVFVSSNFISQNWLHSKIYSVEKIATYINMMGVSIAFQLLINLYCSGMMGLQRQVKANNIQIANSFVRTGLIIAILYYYPKLEIYFYWQMFTNLCFFIYARYQLWHVLGGKSNNYNFNKNIFISLLKFALGMMGMALIGGINTQIDKIIVSKLLPLKTYGEYSLASIFGQISSILTLPIAVAALPKLIKNIHLDNEENNLFFHKNSFIITAISVNFTILMVVFGSQYIYLWTHDYEITQSILSTTKLLLIGGLFLALQFMPYHLALANGYTKANLRLGLIMLILTIPLNYFLIKNIGILGAGYTWIFLNFVAFVVIGYVIIKKFLGFNNFKFWIFYDVLVPVLINSITYLGFELFFKKYLILDGYRFIIYSIIFVLSNFLLCAVFYDVKYNSLGFLKKIIKF